MSRMLRALFLLTDLSFLLYWMATAFHWIPPEYAYQDYTDPLLVSWNWSFLPLDLLISFTGFLSLYLHHRSRPEWRTWVLISLVLTFCSGLQAIAFWVIRHDFNLSWWLANLYLLVYPLFFLPKLIRPNREA